MRIALVVNEASGAGADPDSLRARLEGAGAEVVAAVAPAAGDEAAELAPLRAERVAVAGGDGTIAPVAAAAGELGLPVAVLPAGTANDFARALGVPLDLEAACRLAAIGTRVRAVELGWIGERPFLNVASLGLAALAAERARALKRRLGPIAYPTAAIRAGLTGAPTACTIRCDGDQVFAGEVWQAIVACSGGFGGGSSVEQADPHDGWLDLTVVPAGPRAALAAYGIRMRTGRITAARRVLHCRGEVVEVDAPDGAGWNVDGEVLRVGSATLRVEHRAVEVVVG